MTKDKQGDLISRREALNCLKATNLKKFDFILEARNKIKSLPSYQPNIEVIRQEIETKRNFCRAKGTVSYGLRGAVLKEVLDIIDKHIQKGEDR